jgi:ribosomal protein L16/L10AE
MSKKGRRRHKQRRQKPTSRVLEAPGLRVEQRGRLMITEVNRTPEQQDKVQEGLHEAALKLPGDIVAKAIVCVTCC